MRNRWEVGLRKRVFSETPLLLITPCSSLLQENQPSQHTQDTTTKTTRDKTARPKRKGEGERNKRKLPETPTTPKDHSYFSPRLFLRLNESRPRGAGIKHDTRHGHRHPWCRATVPGIKQEKEKVGGGEEARMGLETVPSRACE